MTAHFEALNLQLLLISGKHKVHINAGFMSFKNSCRFQTFFKPFSIMIYALFTGK